MVNASEALSLILVGAFWGCTNPFMRKGFVETKQSTISTPTDDNGHNNDNDNNAGSMKSFIIQKLSLLVNIKVWLPYLINQCGSLLYYKTLASSNLTLSVPICNATAMVFSSITSALLGERINQPWRAAFGVILVLVGVAICMHSSSLGESEQVVVDAVSYSTSFEDGDMMQNGEVYVDDSQSSINGGENMQQQQQDPYEYEGIDMQEEL